jgi:hypothetical protein
MLTTRRTFLRQMPVAAAAAGALVSTTALAVPAAEAVQSASVSDEIVALIAEWNAACDQHALAWRAYDDWMRATPPWSRGPNDSTATGEAWFAARDRVEEVETRLKRAIRKSDLDLRALYKGA